MTGEDSIYSDSTNTKCTKVEAWLQNKMGDPEDPLYLIVLS